MNPILNRLFRPLAVTIALAWVPAFAAETPPAWDDTRLKGWSEAFEVVTIPSSQAGAASQQAMWHATTSPTPQPLIISLHSWSGDFRQHDPLAAAAVARGFNYIHPDFRGPNNKAEACGSELVVADIDDAIQYALDHGRVDRTNIHVIGTSGGGHATMLAWMRSHHDVRSFSAWVGISDLEKWHHESVGRGARYATDLCLVTTGTPNRFDPVEARRRSPLFMATPVARRERSKLLLHAGVHDGYTGSVPITHTIDFYNQVVRDFSPQDLTALVPAAITEALLRQRALPVEGQAAPKPGEIIYQRQFQDRIRLEIFEGGHEMVVARALDHVPSFTILALGDSNGAAPDGWVAQLRTLRFPDLVLNASIAGNTIGFDNLDNPALNSLRNLDQHIAQAVAANGAIDAVVVLLGTNDCKAVFADRGAEVRANMEQLLERVRAHPLLQAHPPKILVVSPPPMGPADRLGPKYLNGPARVARLAADLRAIAERNNCAYVDIHTPLQTVFPPLTPDGVHLLADGQRLIARLILAEGVQVGVFPASGGDKAAPEPATPAPAKK